MVDMSAEEFAQRAFDLNLLDARQFESIWSELGSRHVPLADVQRVVLRRELLTNYQVERLLSDKRGGFFYGNYKVLYLVGTGTFARVYRAVHGETDQIVAVKVLRQRYSDDVAKTEHFIREAKTVMPLRHPNIVPIYEVQSQRANHYMVMDFVEGQNLRDAIKIRKKLEVLESLSIISDVVSALDYALSKGVTHRDIKLSNVLLSSRRVARLVDFGLSSNEAKATDETVANNPNPRSIDYAGLERTSGVRKDDPRSDIYFTGCMLYHILTGHAPLHETRDRIQRLSVTRFHDIKPITKWEPDLPHRLVALVGRAMELNPERRFSIPAEMLVEVKETIERLKAGEADGEPASGAAAGGSTTASAAKASVRLEGHARKVMLVDDNATIQDAVREKLKEKGYRVLVTSDPQRALARFEDDRQVADCVVFSAGSLEDAALEAFNRLGADERTSHVPAILMVDKHQRDLVESADLADHRVILHMPLKLSALRQTLRNLLSAEPAGS